MRFAAAAWSTLAPLLAADEAPVDFGRDVLPLLADRCFQCHGPDEPARKAGLRLDMREGAMAPASSGNVAVVAGEPELSELIARIEHESPKKRMPPAGSGKELDARERATLRRWVEQGAPWAGHWAWAAPSASPLPEVSDASWCREPLDRFVLARLETEGLAPSPPADPVTWLRRATLALTGLPPTIEAVDRFVAEVARENPAEPAARPGAASRPAARPDAFDRAVDALLASPHYGERMALPWLDAARYADSNGFQQDGDTHQWVWRDWLVRALNDDVPQDRLAELLLAGDLLPATTPAERLDQQVASGLQRCAMLNGEGGAIPEEQRNVLVFDRVDVFATAFLGLTAACAQCHDHKYDPITQRDYYALFAFWNQVPESGVPPGGGQYRIAEPSVRAGTTEQMEELEASEAELVAADAAVAAARSEPAFVQALATWEAARRAAAETLRIGPWQAAAPIVAASFDEAAAIDSLVAEIGRESLAVAWAERPELADGVVHRLDGDNTSFLFERTLQVAAPLRLTLHFGSDDALRVRVDGRVVLDRKVTRAAAPDQDRVEVELSAGEHRLRMQIVNGGGPGGFWFEARPGDPPPEPTAALERQRTARAARDARRDALPQVMVMSDGQPRTTRVLARGNYETPLEEVHAAVPTFLPPLAATGAPRPPDRLALARWLATPENPLFSRVLVNRAWQHFFCIGLVKTSENFGVQGEAPSHPELLDTLAVALRDELRWSMKSLHRSIVTSATFRQQSGRVGRRGEELQARDPENRLLARGPRQRLPAMVLRDVALAASGRLVAELGGKPVYPLQPADIWSGLAITRERDFTYPQSSGADLWRRSLYTFWRRTVAPGNMFDASPRQTCKVRLPVTSTPLQALTLLNDPTWVMAAEALAARALQEAGEPDAALVRAFRLVLARTPAEAELAVLRRTVERARANFAEPVAALAVACLVILNLDEAQTCE
jgi:mono/diheme cytochrome c family protein